MTEPITTTDAARQILDWVAKVRDAKKPVTQQMLLNLHFFLGHQLAVKSEKTNELMIPSDKDLEDLSRNEHVYIMIDNVIKTAVKTVLAELASEVPALYLVPNDTTQHAEDVAKVGTKCFDALRHQTDYTLTHFKTLLWSIICGQGYKWIHPDEWAGGKNVITRPNPEFQPRLRGKRPGPKDNPSWFKEFIEIEVPKEPKVLIDLLSPFELYGPAGVDEIDDWTRLAIVRGMDKKTVEDSYGVRDLKPGEDTTKVFIDDSDSGNLTLEKRTDQKEVIEYFEKPSPQKPQGAHYVLCDDKIIFDGMKHPNWDKIVMENGKPNWQKSTWGGYRIVQYPFELGLVSHWARGLPEGVIGKQRKINLFWTIMLTNRIRTGALKLISRKSCMLQDEDLTDEPSVWDIPDGATADPHWLAVPNMPGDIMAMLQKLYERFEEETVGRLSKGLEPERRMPYLSVQYLREVNLKKFVPQYKQVERAEEKTGMGYLKARKQFNPKSMLSQLGEIPAYEKKDFVMDDLGDFEVRVEAGSGVPQSRAGQIAISLEAQKYGALNLQEHTNKVAFLRMIDSPYSKEILQNITRATEQAKLENREMLAAAKAWIAEGAQEPIKMAVHANKFHDHLAHIDTHSQDLNSPAYLENPLAYSGHVFHIEEHLGFLQTKTQPGMGPTPPKPEEPLGIEGLELEPMPAAGPIPAVAQPPGPEAIGPVEEQG